MEVTEILQAISTVGFPIVMAIMLWRYISSTQKELIEKLADISANIAKLCAKLGKDLEEE